MYLIYAPVMALANGYMSVTQQYAHGAYVHACMCTYKITNLHSVFKSAVSLNPSLFLIGCPGLLVDL